MKHWIISNFVAETNNFKKFAGGAVIVAAFGVEKIDLNFNLIFKAQYCRITKKEGKHKLDINLKQFQNTNVLSIYQIKLNFQYIRFDTDYVQ